MKLSDKNRLNKLFYNANPELIKIQNLIYESTIANDRLRYTNKKTTKYLFREISESIEKIFKLKLFENTIKKRFEYLYYYFGRRDLGLMRETLKQEVNNNKDMYDKNLTEITGELSRIILNEFNKDKNFVKLTKNDMDEFMLNIIRLLKTFQTKMKY